MPGDALGTRHFGVILPWSEEQAKLYLADPSYNVIEIRAYRDLRSTVGLGRSAYQYADA
jgi:extradiol dioxygenase family protein